MRGDDTVVLTVPRERGYLSLLHLVLGGIALQRDLSLDSLDDMLLAVDNLLADDKVVDEDLTMSVTVGADSLSITLEALADPCLHDNLTKRRLPGEAGEQRIDVSLLLDSLVTEYHVLEQTGEHYAVELRKRVR
jgi:hypothetical protein